VDRPFDTALKTLAELSPADWLPLAKRRRRRVTVEDSDVGTIVSGATDKLYRVHDEPEYLLQRRYWGWKNLQLTRPSYAGAANRAAKRAARKRRGACCCCKARRSSVLRTPPPERRWRASTTLHGSKNWGYAS
jgi:hypothetical protein